MKYESKIIGINPLWISVLLIGAYLIVYATGGDNAKWNYIGFEVIFPFYMAIVIGEWCKTRTDPMYDVVSAQGRSLFGWIVRRYIFLFVTVGITIFIGMLFFSRISENVSSIDLLFAFLPTAFFLSSICVFISMLGNIPHIPTLIVGVLWLFSIMAISLLRFTPIQYIYLFAGYAGINGSLWRMNKVFLLSMGAVTWIGIFAICKKRICCK